MIYRDVYRDVGWEGEYVITFHILGRRYWPGVHLFDSTGQLGMESVRYAAQRLPSRAPTKVSRRSIAPEVYLFLLPFSGHGSCIGGRHTTLFGIFYIRVLRPEL